MRQTTGLNIHRYFTDMCLRIERDCQSFFNVIIPHAYITDGLYIMGGEI